MSSRSFVANAFHPFPAFAQDLFDHVLWSRHGRPGANTRTALGSACAVIPLPLRRVGQHAVCLLHLTEQRGAASAVGMHALDEAHVGLPHFISRRGRIDIEQLVVIHSLPMVATSATSVASVGSVGSGRSRRQRRPPQALRALLVICGAGSVARYNNSGDVDLAADVMGYFATWVTA